MVLLILNKEHIIVYGLDVCNILDGEGNELRNESLTVDSKGEEHTAYTVDMRFSLDEVGEKNLRLALKLKPEDEIGGIYVGFGVSNKGKVTIENGIVPTVNGSGDFIKISHNAMQAINDAFIDEAGGVDKFREFLYGVANLTEKDFGIKPYIMEENDLFYKQEHDAENLYFILYYSIVDANVDHFAWRKDNEVCAWDRNRCLEECADVLEHGASMSGFNYGIDELNRILAKERFPKSVAIALDDLTDMLEQKKVDKMRSEMDEIR